MQIRSMILTISLIISAGCLGVGYILAGYWLIFPVFILMVLLWKLLYKKSALWSSSSLLLIHISLTAIGIIADFSTILMVISGTTAVVWWDLLQFNQSNTGMSSGKTGKVLEKNHLKTLTVTVGVSLMLAMLSANFSLQFPFVINIFLILMAIGGLIIGFQYIVNAKD